jgi:hypothetical protein
MRKLLLLALCAVPGWAATWYVAPSPTGNDSTGTGSFASPFATIGHAAGVAGSGDTILVEDGTYSFSCSNPDSSMGLVISGAPASAITIKPYSTNLYAVQLNGAGCHSIFNVGSGARNWVIQGLDFSGSKWGGIWANNSTGSSNITVKGNRFHNIGNISNTTSLGVAGIFLGSSESYWTVDGNIFTNIGRTDSGGALMLDHDHGLYGYANHVTIINNLFYNLTRGWGAQISPGATYWTLANNVFYGIAPDCSATPGACAEDGVIAMWQDSGTNGGAGESNILIENNIIYQPQTDVIHTSGSASTIGTSSTFNYNLVYGTTTLSNQTLPMTIGSQQAALWGTSSAYNPLFVSAGTGNFQVQAGSPAIGAGVDLSATFTDDFAGATRTTPWDIGAYESGATGSPVLTLSPASVTFATPVTVGQTGTEIQLVTYGNDVSATGSLTLSNATLAGDFTWGGTGTCSIPQTLTAGQSCTISVKFAPTAAGARTGTLTITDNATGSPRAIPLTGNAPYGFTVQATDSASTTASATLSITVTANSTAGPGGAVSGPGFALPGSAVIH